MPVEGETLADYVLGRVIGCGSSGTVHMALDRRHGGWVAVKILASGGVRTGTEQDELRVRFLREAEIAKRLRHPDIVTIHAVGESAGSLWLAMELVQGCSLDRYVLPTRLLPAPVALGIAVRIARALAHAHAMGIVHRDIKPANVLVDLASNRVKLTDFGTARILDSSQTRTEMMLGTPAYMAPELLAGASALASADIYALGVLLYQLLVGALPFESPALGDLLRRIATEAAPDLRVRRPELPPALAGLVAALLAKRPGERPAAADLLAQELRVIQHTLQGAGGAA